MVQNLRPPNYLDYVKTGRFRRKLELIRRHLTRAAAAPSTPLMILEMSELDRAVAYFQKYLPFVRIFYAMKANSQSEILQSLWSRQIGFDVASNGEIERAIALGVPGHDLILSNPHKDAKTLEAMFSRQIGVYTFDSEAELRKIAQYRWRSSANFSPKGLVRFAPRLEDSDVQTDLSSKFGCPIEDVASLVGLAREMRLEVKGVHFHVGSNCTHLMTYLKNFTIALELIEKCNHEFGLQMDTIDIGGGFPCRTGDFRGIDGLDDFYAQLGSELFKLNKKSFNILAEPGRTLAGPVGTLVTTVIGRRNIKGREWLILDDGLYGCFSPIYHDQAKYVYFPLDERFHADYDPKRLKNYILAGPTCDSFDTIAREVQLPAEMDIGDQIFVADNGAYTLDNKTLFNGFKGVETIVDRQVGEAEIWERRLEL